MGRVEEEQHCIAADDDDDVGPTEACDWNSGGHYESAPDSLKFMCFFKIILIQALSSS